jgi:hypothetical protein
MGTNGTTRNATLATRGRVFLIAAALLAGAVVTLPAQQTGSSSGGGKEITIEELFLKSVEMQILREKAFSDDYEIKLGALDDLEKKIDNGSYRSDDTQVEFVAEYLSLEGSGHVTRQDGHQINDFPEVRRRAASLLGRMGTDQAKDALVRVLFIDPDPMVKSEAAYGLGVIGLNKNNEVSQALAFAYSREDPSKPDNNFGYALCLAVEKIAKKTGGIKDPGAYTMLVKIAQGNYLRTVKTKALQVLEELKAAH